MPTPVSVSACDNELYILALQGNASIGSWGSTEILHIMSGNNDPVAYSFNLESVLPPGTYTLVFIGIDWGVTWNFAVTVGGTPYGASGPSALGFAWTANTPPITI
jgi:hypothetical protein